MHKNQKHGKITVVILLKETEFSESYFYLSSNSKKITKHVNVKKSITFYGISNFHSSIFKSKKISERTKFYSGILVVIYPSSFSSTISSIALKRNQEKPSTIANNE